jgi:hypothetical protein
LVAEALAFVVGVLSFLVVEGLQVEVRVVEGAGLETEDFRLETESYEHN